MNVKHIMYIHLIEIPEAASDPQRNGISPQKYRKQPYLIASEVQPVILTGTDPQ